MKRWTVVLVAGAIVASAGGAGWLVADLRADLHEERREKQRVTLAKDSSDQEAERLARRLRRTRRDLDVVAKRVRRARAQLRLARRPNALVERIADERFCFNPYDARFSGWVRGPLRADVDGDGSVDRVYTVGRPGLLGRACRYFVVVETADRRYAARVTSRRLSFDGPSAFQLYLAPAAAAEVDAVPGAEILVKVSQGASVEAALLYALVGDELVRVRVEGEPIDVLSYSGSLCCGSALDCVAGDVVYSGYGRAGDGPHFKVTRRAFLLAEGVLERRGVERHRLRFEQLDRFGEFGGRPLSGCAGYVRAPAAPAAADGPFVARGL